MEQEEVVNDDDNVDSSLTVTQEKVLALLPVASGLLSAWGSLEIIRIILFKKRRPPPPPPPRQDESDDTEEEQTQRQRQSARRQHRHSSSSSCYQRTMLGLSASDLVSSLVLSLQSFLLPASEPRTWAVGNHASCVVMGFLQQAAGTNIFYNCMLSIVFVLTIRYGVSEARLAKVYEPVLHAVSLGFPLVTACIAIPWYGPLDVGQFCWISGPQSARVAYPVAGVPYILITLIIPMNNFLIYRHAVRRQQQQQERCTWSSSSSSDNDNENNNGQQDKSRSSQCSSSHDGTSFDNEPTGNSALQMQEARRRMARRQDSEHRRQQRVKQLAWQAFYYVAAFLVTQLPPLALRVCAHALQVNRRNEQELFVLLVLQAVLSPLQGLFNFIIFTQTTYLREIG